MARRPSKARVRPGHFLARSRTSDRGSWDPLHAPTVANKQNRLGTVAASRKGPEVRRHSRPSRQPLCGCSSRLVHQPRRGGGRDASALKVATEGATSVGHRPSASDAACLQLGAPMWARKSAGKAKRTSVADGGLLISRRFGAPVIREFHLPTLALGENQAALVVRHLFPLPDFFRRAEAPHAYAGLSVKAADISTWRF